MVVVVRQMVWSLRMLASHSQLAWTRSWTRPRRHGRGSPAMHAHAMDEAAQAHGQGTDLTSQTGRLTVELDTELAQNELVRAPASLERRRAAKLCIMCGLHKESVEERERKVTNDWSIFY